MLLDNLQKDLYQIKNLLLINSTIRKLLYYDTSDALTKQEVNIETTRDYIVLSPIFDTTKEPYNKNTFITITIKRVSRNLENNMLAFQLIVNAMSRIDLWEIDNKVRVLEMVNQIIYSLDNEKISTSHKLYFDSFNMVVLNENISGYSVLFDIVEGGGLENEF